MSNEQIEQSVTDELAFDPKIDSSAIAVAADDGVVTLRGTVGSLRQKREAKHDAQRVRGVTKVDDELEVRLMDDDVRNDAEIRGSVLQAFVLNDVVPSTIDAEVFQGKVTLTGTANWQYQLDEAKHIATSVTGVRGLFDEVAILPPAPTTGELETAIEKAMERNARLDAENVKVESSNGTVTLSGTVRSWADHDDAVSAAWAAPGVTSVKDHILVLY
jgi:osmotically-inducible protein OsmY